MINEEILAALKSALERGQSLQRAMATLYTSGYRKEEIEEAARSLLEFSNQNQLQQPVRTMLKAPEAKPVRQMPIISQSTKPRPELNSYMPPSAPPSQPQLESQGKSKGFFQKLLGIVQKRKGEAQPAKISEPKPAAVQKVSNYEQSQEKNGSKEKTIIFVLIFLMIFLFALLGVIFLFREELIAFFGSLFS